MLPAGCTVNNMAVTVWRGTSEPGHCYIDAWTELREVTAVGVISTAIDISGDVSVIGHGMQGNRIAFRQAKCNEADDDGIGTSADALV